MKISFLALCLLLITTVLCANPSAGPVSIVSELWFNEAGHTMVEFALFNSPPIRLQAFSLRHGDFQQNIPLNTIMTESSPPIVVDITELFPELVLNPEADSLWIYKYSNVHNKLKWGNSFSCYINSIEPGQSIAYNYADYELTLCKEEPPTPGSNAYQVNARTVVTVVVTDQNNNPVPGVPIMNNSTGLYSNFTDSNGIFMDIVPAKCYNLNVIHPLTEETIYQNQFWLDTNAELIIPIRINYTANEDNTAPVLPKKGLLAFPTPFNFISNETISFQYDGSSKPHGQSIIKLYDTKGRYVCQIPISAKGIASWKPDRNIGSGIYFARLISGNRILDTATITIIK